MTVSPKSADLRLRQIGQSAFGILSSVIGTIAIFIVVARSLGPASFGIFAFSYAAASLTGILFDFGYMTRLLKESREYASAGKASLASISLWFKTSLFFVLSAVLLFFVLVSGQDLILMSILWLGVALISFANFFSAMLRGLGHHLADAINNFVANLAGASLAVSLYFASSSPHQFATVFVLTGGTYFLLTVRLWKRYCVVKFSSFKLNDFATEFRKNSAYVLDAVAQRSFGFLDVLMLSAVASPVAVGLYQAGQKIAQGANIFAQPFNNVFLPHLSRQATNAEAFARSSRRSFLLQAAFGLTAFAGLALIGPFIITLLYSEEYVATKGLMWAFGLLVCVRYISAALTMQITALGLQKIRTIINLSCVGVLVVAGLLLSRSFGALGMILAAAFASTLIGIGAFLVRRRTLAQTKRFASPTDASPPTP